MSAIAAADDSKINQRQKKADEMKRLRRFKPVLLVVAAVVAGCGAPPVAQAPKASAPAATAMSCTERSAAARPPKNPIVELAWCIAETDNLYDQDQLFRETLGIKDYGTAEVPRGVRAFVGDKREQFDRLPVGILGFEYARENPKGPQISGNRYVSFGIDPRKSCVKLEDIFATFGRDFKASPVPIKVPSPAMPGASVGDMPKAGGIFGVFYKSPGVFSDNASAFVQFTFDYYECANRISISRNYFASEQLEKQK